MSNSDKMPPIRMRAPVALDDCGAAMAAEILGDRWTLLIIREAFYGVKRYDDMLADLDAPRSVLTQRLKRLVENGILTREPYREQGARTRYAYVLSDTGKAFATTLIALIQWADANFRDKTPPIEIVDAKTGKTLKAALVNEDARTIPLDRVRVNVKRR